MYEFSNTNSKHIAVIGDVMLDHYLYGTCDRISPEAPVQVIDITNETYTLGGAGNVLENLISLGCSASLVTVCGNDDGAKIIEAELKQSGASFYAVICDEKRKTTIKTRVIASKHQLMRLDRENRNDIDTNTGKQIMDALGKIVKNISVLILSDYCKGVLTKDLVKSITALCRENNVTTIVDSKDKNLLKYAGIDIFKPNKKEASIAAGVAIVNDETLEEACKIIASATNCKAVVVTLSEEGIAIFDEGKLEKIPTKAIEVFDVTGAGDTVIASLAFGLANKLSIRDAAGFANHAAAVVVAKAGSATASIDEINMHLSMLKT